MAYYTPDWIRKLVKQDHEAIKKEINSKGGDFRSYIDSALPFTLYIDIAQIRKEILQKEAPFIQELTKLLGLENPQQIITELDNTYQAVINDFINNPRLVTITDKELQQKFDNLNSIIASDGDIRKVLKQEFNKTLIVSNLSKPNTRVLIIYTNFANVSTSFGVLFKKLFNYNAFSDLIDDKLDSGKGAVPREIVRAFLNGNFGKLQNIGHIEVDVISSKTREVKRGLVTPRLLQSLLSLPKAQAQRITRDFSQETGQAETRLVIRKLFTKNKLVLEMIVENAFLIGKIEAQQANAIKSKFERAYEIGKNFTDFLRKNAKYLSDLETSKTLNQYIADSVLSAMKGKTVQPYTSNTKITQKTDISIKTVKVKLPKPVESTSTLPKLSKTDNVNTAFLISLQNLLNSMIVEKVKQNMGSGNRKDILNLRTGRFAESVKIERISQGREGMITAFYTYMRNPYGTFSEGGQQQLPRSRDPKLLISKSIREIAQTKVKNRLRAVLV
jgi:hypothetical protein